MRAARRLLAATAAGAMLFGGTAALGTGEAVADTIEPYRPSGKAIVSGAYDLSADQIGKVSISTEKVGGGTVVVVDVRGHMQGLDLAKCTVFVQHANTTTGAIVDDQADIDLEATGNGVARLGPFSGGDFTQLGSSCMAMLGEDRYYQGRLIDPYPLKITLSGNGTTGTELPPERTNPWTPTPRTEQPELPITAPTPQSCTDAIQRDVDQLGTGFQVGDLIQEQIIRRGGLETGLQTFCFLYEVVREDKFDPQEMGQSACRAVRSLVPADLAYDLASLFAQAAGENAEADVLRESSKIYSGLCEY